MKLNKIRGHNRIHKQIINWQNENLKLNLDYIKRNQRGRIDIDVHPWCDIPIIKSSFPEPYGKTRQKILNALLEIYKSWKKQLDDLNEPYYLKVWLYEHRFSRSQVVCAMGDSLDYYETTFRKPDKAKEINLNSYGNLKSKMSVLKWELHVDEDIYNNITVGTKDLYANFKDFEDSNRWFRRLLKRPHRAEKTEVIDGIEELYFFKKGNVWIGGK